MRESLPIEVRFNNKYEINQQNDCWEWQYSTNNIGYGMFRWAKGIMRTAHRVSYEMFIGPIPKGMCVCHKCDNPKCVNPDHLWLGTVKQNMQDKVLKGRHIGRKPGFKQPIGTCKHCGIVRPINILGKFHNDKCKSKP